MQTMAPQWQKYTLQAKLENLLLLCPLDYTEVD